MEFTELYFNTEDPNFDFDDSCSIDTRGKYITFFISLKKDEYKIDNNKLIIDDICLNKIKNKLIRKESNHFSHLKNEMLSELDHHHIISLGEGYFIADFWEDISDEDIKLTVNEFVIKALLE